MGNHSAVLFKASLTYKLKKERCILKKILILILCFFLIPFKTSAFEISAQSYILTEKESGRVLIEKNADEKRGMASTTKIMTAIIALENGNLQSTATVSKTASNTEGSSIYLKPLEKMTLENLLYGLLLASGNDASVAIGEHIAGNKYAFCEMMNKKAKNLGMENTHFDNPCGLSSVNHYSTARDMAVLTRYALNNEKFAEIVMSKNKVIKSSSGENDRYIKNHNKLLWNYEGTTGVKTGFTKKDGRCLVSSASRGGVELICVTLNAPDDWSDHKNLFDYGFDMLSHKKIASKGTNVGNISVVKGKTPSVLCELKEDFYLTVKKDDKITCEYILPETIEAPVHKGQELGSVVYYLNNQKSGEVKIISAESVEVTDKIKAVQQFINLIINLMNL